MYVHWGITNLRLHECVGSRAGFCNAESLKEIYFWYHGTPALCTFFLSRCFLAGLRGTVTHMLVLKKRFAASQNYNVKQNF